MTRLCIETLERRELPSAAVPVGATAGLSEPPAIIRGMDHPGTEPGPVEGGRLGVVSPGPTNQSGWFFLLPYLEQENVSRGTAGSGVGLGLTAPLGSTKGSLWDLDIWETARVSHGTAGADSATLPHWDGALPQGIIAVLIGLRSAADSQGSQTAADPADPGAQNVPTVDDMAENGGFAAPWATFPSSVQRAGNDWIGQQRRGTAVGNPGDAELHADRDVDGEGELGTDFMGWLPGTLIDHYSTQRKLISGAEVDLGFTLYAVDTPTGTNGGLAKQGVLFHDSKVRFADITDGTSNTLMVGELSHSTNRDGPVIADCGLRIADCKSVLQSAIRIPPSAMEGGAYVPGSEAAVSALFNTDL